VSGACDVVQFTSVALAGLSLAPGLAHHKGTARRQAPGDQRFDKTVAAGDPDGPAGRARDAFDQVAAVTTLQLYSMLAAAVAIFRMRARDGIANIASL
jgi:hypothetical protein